VLDELTACLERIRSKIGTHRAGLRENEFRTRTVLIDPLLSVLGWDVTDPSCVTVEYATDDGKRADYALRQSVGKPIAIIEAKKLDSRELTSDAKGQVVNYSITDGVRFAILTDGDLWFVYDVFKPVALAEKEMLKVRISEGSIPQHALTFLLLWNSNLLTEKPIQAKSPEVLYTTPEGIDTSTDEVETGHRPGPVSPITTEDWIGLDELISRSMEKTEPPVEVRFWDGETESLSNWIDIPLKTIEKCLELGLLNRGSMPFGTEKKYFANSEAKTERGGKMRSVFLKKYRVHVERNLSRTECCKRVKEVVRLLNHSDKGIRFRFG